MKTNSEAIYATKASPLGTLSWGRCTKKTENGNTILYFSVFDWPKDGKLVIPEVVQPVMSAKLLMDKSSLKVKNSDRGIEISVPAKAPDAIASVIKVTLKGKIEAATKEATKKMKTGALD